MAVTSLVVEPRKPTRLHSVSERNNESPFSLLARWQAFLDVAGKCNETTRREYRRHITAFWADLADTAWQGERDPLEVTEDDLVDYLSAMDPRGMQRAMFIRAFRSFYGWGWDRAGLERNPAEHLRSKKPKYGPAASLSVANMERLLKAADTLDPRARWAIQLQYATACRAGSLLALEARDLAEGSAGPVIHFRVAKGDKPYAVPAGPKAIEAWRKLIELEDFVPKMSKHRRATVVGVGYDVYKEWVKGAGAKAGLDVTSHLLRHTAITRMTDNGVDIRSIVELANWSDGSQLRRYSTASDPNLRQAVDIL
jgi:site-specific recombinase XerD